MIKLTIYVPAGLGRRAALVVQRLHEQGRLTQGGGTGTSTPCVSFSVFSLFSVFCVYWIYTQVSSSLQSKHFSGRKDPHRRPQTSPYHCQGLLGLKVRTVRPWNLDFIV